MNREIIAAMLVLALGFGFRPVAAGQGEPCTVLSDSFENLSSERWNVSLTQSMAQGKAFVHNGNMVLAATVSKPTEVHATSKFLLHGDFDFQSGYTLREFDKDKPCRFNAGVILHNKADSASYKFYVAQAPDKGVFYRARRDRSGVINEEMTKTEAAPQSGLLRVTRKDGIITFRAFYNGAWKTVHKFEGKNSEPMRVRYKLQTGGKVSEWSQACPVTFLVDDFTILSCTPANR